MTKVTKQIIINIAIALCIYTPVVLFVIGGEKTDVLGRFIIAVFAVCISLLTAIITSNHYD